MRPCTGSTTRTRSTASSGSPPSPGSRNWPTRIRKSSRYFGKKLCYWAHFNCCKWPKIEHIWLSDHTELELEPYSITVFFLEFMIIWEQLTDFYQFVLNLSAKFVSRKFRRPSRTASRKLWSTRMSWRSKQTSRWTSSVSSKYRQKISIISTYLCSSQISLINWVGPHQCDQ